MRSHRVREALSCVVRMWFASVWFFSLSRRISGKLEARGKDVPLFQASGAEESVFCLVACCAVHRAWARKRKRKEEQGMIITYFAGPGWGAPSSQAVISVFHPLPRLISRLLDSTQHVPALAQQHNDPRKDGPLCQRARWRVDEWRVGRGRAGEGRQWVRRWLGGGREEVGKTYGWW